MIVQTFQSANKFISLLLMVGIIFSSQTHAEKNDTPVDLEKVKFEAYLDGLIGAQFDNLKLAGLTMAIIKDNKVWLLRGDGFADLESRTPVDPNTHMFRPGSVSKLLTWTAVMQLVEQGQLDLDADVNTYLTQFE